MKIVTINVKEIDDNSHKRWLNIENIQEEITLNTRLLLVCKNKNIIIGAKVVNINNYLHKAFIEYQFRLGV